LEAVQMVIHDWFAAAVGFNERTRTWDEVDAFLWLRLARSLSVAGPRIPGRGSHPPELLSADERMLRLLADRRLLPRQVALILRRPEAHRDFFVGTLSEHVELNANETAQFIDMSCDLRKLLGKKNLQELFQIPQLSEVLANQEFSRKRKGETLLKRMRILRYPRYQIQAESFTSSWTLLQLGQKIRPDRNLFIERGILEMTISSGSLLEFRRAVEQLHRSLSSPAWEKIWEE
jgi:hypothetical protein